MRLIDELPFDLWDQAATVQCAGHHLPRRYGYKVWWSLLGAQRGSTLSELVLSSAVQSDGGGSHTSVTSLSCPILVVYIISCQHRVAPASIDPLRKFLHRHGLQDERVYLCTCPFGPKERAMMIISRLHCGSRSRGHLFSSCQRVLSRRKYNSSTTSTPCTKRP